ncbi:MAG: hypothetical protein KGI49_02660 [Patescibacteria group bacterium]|nr:hypothetical protein [Patescibacteria group bacterium]
MKNENSVNGSLTIKVFRPTKSGWLLLSQDGSDYTLKGACLEHNGCLRTVAMALIKDKLCGTHRTFANIFTGGDILAFVPNGNDEVHCIIPNEPFWSEWIDGSTKPETRFFWKETAAPEVFQRYVGYFRHAPELC